MCEATADWDDPLWTNKQHLMSRLGASGHSVLYLDSLGLRRPSASSGDLRRIARRLRDWRPVAVEVAPGVWRDAPLVVPLHAIPAVRALNESLLHWRLRRNRRRHAIENAVLWTFSPMGHRLFNRRWHTALVYHCVDNIPDDPGMDKTFLLAEERATISIADVCIASSRPLLGRLEQLGALRPLYWPNPADTKRFATAERTPRAGRSVIGFAGAIQSNKVDIDLIVDLALSLPDFDFHLAGPVDTGGAEDASRRLRVAKNVRLLGVIGRDQLPAVIASFDVAIIPYHINAYTRFIYPMKVFEYLAAGAPVVSTPLPSLVGEVEYVAFASDATGFAEAVRTALQTAHDSTSVAGRRAYAASHSWENRLAEANRLLSKLPASVSS